VLIGEAGTGRPSGNGTVSGSVPAEAASAIHDGGCVVNELVEAKQNNQVRRLMSRWQRYELIALDEVGMFRWPTSGRVLFQVISDRAERAAIIVTTNLPFSEWTTVFESTIVQGVIGPDYGPGAYYRDGTESFRFRRTMEKRRSGERRRRRVGAVLPPRRPFRLNGAAQGATPASLPPGRQNAYRRNEAEYQYPGGPN